MARNVPMQTYGTIILGMTSVYVWNYTLHLLFHDWLVPLLHSFDAAASGIERCIGIVHVQRCLWRGGGRIPASDRLVQKFTNWFVYDTLCSITQYVSYMSRCVSMSQYVLYTNHCVSCMIQYGSRMIHIGSIMTYVSLYSIVSRMIHDTINVMPHDTICSRMVQYGMQWMYHVWNKECHETKRIIYGMV